MKSRNRLYSKPAKRRSKAGESYAVSNTQYEKLEPKKLLAIDFGPAVNLVSNGDFEIAPSHTENRLSSAIEVAGWQTLGDQSQQVLGVRPNKTDGSQYALHLDAKDDRHDIIYQNVETEAGQNYLLTFDYVGQAGGKTRLSNDFSVFWNGELVTRYQAGDIWQTGGVVLEGGNYGTSRLEFRELAETSDPGGDGIGPILDNIFVQEWSQPTLVNEGFEQEGLKSWSRFRTGESVGEHQLEYKWASEGDHVLKLNAHESQTDRLVREFDLQPNQEYLISFDVKGTYGEDSVSNELRVRWNGEWVSTIRGVDRWNRQFIKVSADAEGRGELMLGESPSGDVTVGAFIDAFNLHEIPSQVLSNFRNSSSLDFQINDSDRSLFPGQQIQLSWSGPEAHGYWVQLYDASGPVNTTGFVEGGSPEGNIHSIDRSGIGLGQQTSFEFEVPALPAGSYELKLIAWDFIDGPGSGRASTADAAYLDIDVTSRSQFGVFIYDNTVSPGQELRIAWRIDGALLPEGFEQSSVLRISSPSQFGRRPFQLNAPANTLLYNFLDQQPDHSWYEDTYVSPDGAQVDFLKGETIVRLSNELIVGDALPINVSFQVNGAAYSCGNCEVSVNQELSDFSDTSKESFFGSDVDALLQVSNLPPDSFPQSRQWLIDTMARRTLENAELLNFNNPVTSINNAYGGKAIIHGDWNFNRPTTILVHGINTLAAEQVSLGAELAASMSDSHNVVSFHWGTVGLDGSQRTFAEVINNLENGEAEARRIADAAVDLTLLVELFTSIYVGAGFNAAGQVSTISHSQGAVVTAMAIPMASDFIVESVWRDAVFVGANLEREVVLDDRELSNIYENSSVNITITNLFSGNDVTVDRGSGFLGWEGSAKELGVAVSHVSLIMLTTSMPNGLK